jgi:hypothetical protein
VGKQIDLKQLQEAVQQFHACQARHVQSVPVAHMAAPDAHRNWTVEVFDLTGHTRAARCFAWEDASGKLVTWLAIEPVQSPIDAVVAQVAAQQRLDSHSQGHEGS